MAGMTSAAMIATAVTCFMIMVIAMYIGVIAKISCE